MLISLNKIKQYVPIPKSISDSALIDLIGSRLVEIEETIDLAPKYQGIYIVKVVKAEPIAGTHLNLCEVDAGAQNSQFNQLDNGLVQVVCGAPNVHSGMLAAWIAPGAIVPATYGNENFRISTRKLQGYESNGMLAALDELDFGTDHEGIIEIDPKSAHPGDALIDVFDLDDIILDVENKSLTHRPDCFGLIGFAREIAGILGQKFVEPTWPTLTEVQDLPIKVKITDAELCPRYDCAVFDLPDHKPSKYLTTSAVFLAKSGMRSIDPLVDLTNIMMLETGQPLHAFDYDKLVAVGGKSTPEIIVRAAMPGEQLQLLDGKTIDCIPEDILITSNNTPVALAGAMGGKNTEIDASTRRVVLESATFSLYHLRKTQMAHGIFSEAITRFTKGQPAGMTWPVLAETVQRLGVAPLAAVDEFAQKPSDNTIKLTVSEINGLLGTQYRPELVVSTLENVGFTVKKSADVLTITAPIWRTDIQLKEDVIEEVGRLLGFDNIPLDLPFKPFSGTEIVPMLRLKSELRTILSDCLAMNELLTYSFVSASLLEKVGQDPSQSYEIVNSISPELQRFRQQIAPSLLDKVRENLKAGHRDFTLYELNQVSNKSFGLTDEQTPVLHTDLGIVCLGDFYQLKMLALRLFRALGLEISYAQMSLRSPAAATYPYLEPAHSVEIFCQGHPVGAFGEIKASVLRRFKLDGAVSALECNLDAIVDVPRTLKIESKLSKFPFVERDLTLKVSADAQFGRFDTLLRSLLDGEGLIFTVTPVSIYQASPDQPTKNLSFHLRFSSPEKTLDSGSISDIMNKITIETAKLGAEIV